MFVGAGPEGPTSVDPIEAAKIGVDIHQAHLDATMQGHEMAMKFATDQAKIAQAREARPTAGPDRAGTAQAAQLPDSGEDGSCPAGPIPSGPNDLAAKREIALEAKEIIESKAFWAVKADMREALVNELVTAKDRERRDEIIAELTVLESVLGRFKARINDYNSTVARTHGRAA